LFVGTDPGLMRLLLAAGLVVTLAVRARTPPSGVAAPRLEPLLPAPGSSLLSLAGLPRLNALRGHLPSRRGGGRGIAAR